MMHTRHAKSLENHIYGAYGIRVGPSRARSAYAGEIVEEDTGWYMLGGRPYDPVLRCFLAADTESPFADGGMNRYAYCGGDPLNRVDPTGEGWFEWLIMGAFTAAAAVATVVTAGAALAAVLPVATVGASAMMTAGGLTTASIAAGVNGLYGAAALTPGLVVAATAVVVDASVVYTQVGSMVAMGTGDQSAQQTLGILSLVGIGASLLTGIPHAAKSMGTMINTLAKRPATAASTSTAILASTARAAPRSPDPARPSATARKEGAGMQNAQAFQNNGGPSPRATEAAGEPRRMAQDDRRQVTELESAAGEVITTPDTTQAPAGKTIRELSWDGISATTPLVLDTHAAVGLNLKKTASGLLVIRASL